MMEQYLTEVMGRLSDGVLVTMLIVLSVWFVVLIFKKSPDEKATQKQKMPCPMCGQEVAK